MLESTLERLVQAEKLIREYQKALSCALQEKRQENGEYVHLPYCSGDRNQLPGTPGISCCCMPERKRLHLAVLAIAEDDYVWPEFIPRHGSYSPSEFAQDVLRGEPVRRL